MLNSAGWQDGGHLRIVGERITNYHQGGSKSSQTYYTLDMPSEAPLLIQAKFLANYISAIHQRHVGESISLAGFSAGGLVARLFMVLNQKQDVPVQTLITIATPHLGTRTAQLASTLQQSPLSMFAPWMGAESFNRSGYLYQDLSPEKPGNILFWLNRQEHPAARYISVIREDGGLFNKDYIVSAESQDMNRVVALTGRSLTVRTRGMHELKPEDAKLILRILQQDQRI
jgi:pimeloyl-ACP methyl ester carboxylesterase